MKVTVGLMALSSILLLLQGSVLCSEFDVDSSSLSSSRVVFTDSGQAEIQENSRPRRFRFSEPSRTVHSSESLTAHPRTSSDLTLSIFVPNKGCNGNGTYCVESEEYPDPGRILDILDSEGNRDLLRMLYHHHQEEEDVSSRLPPVGITSEDTEARVQDTAEVISRDSWDIVSPFPPPPHLEEPLCHEITEYVFPKAAVNAQKQWRFVINLPESVEQGFVQAVRVRRCLEEGQTCAYPECGTKRTVCRQMYDFTKLLAISDKGTKYVDEFMFPSGCKCYSQRLSETYDFMLLRSQGRETVVVEEEQGEESSPRKKRKQALTNPT